MSKQTNSMPRVAFTIIFNGLRHLIHNDYYKFMVENFDLWVIAEGVSKNTGSTAWCNVLPDTIHDNFLSKDGTTQFLDELAKQHSNVKIVRSPTRYWPNKDHQVNAAIEEIKKHYSNCLLWEVDIDEQWNKESLEKSESELIESNAKTGCFLANYYVGKDLVARGVWGEGSHTPYMRLWNWNGELFSTHEPPNLAGGNGHTVLLTPRFNHYSYFFEEDVLFKELYYGGYTGLHSRWSAVQTSPTFPIHIRSLLGNNTGWANTDTFIHKI